MNIETLQRNVRYAAETIYKETGKSVGGPTNQCRRFVGAALSGLLPNDALLGYLQLIEEERVGVRRLEMLYAEYPPLEEVLQCYGDNPGVPIIIEGPFIKNINEFHCAAIICNGGGQWAIADSLLEKGLDIVNSPDDVVAWARKTFYLDTAFFYPVEVNG